MKHHLVRIHETGAPGVMHVETADIGAPGNGQVRLRHDAIGLNFIDTLFRSGAYPVTLPFDMGVEGAGVVEAVGPGVANLSVGDRVAYFFSPGAYADVRLIGADLLVKLPDDISTRLAAALITKGLTAWAMLKGAHAVKPGEFVLVNGAAGGVGSMVASWAKALGATVIAVVGTPAKADGVRSRGIEHVLSSGDPDFDAKIRSITGGHGVDVVYEFVGKATFRQSVQALRDSGDLIHVGSASGSIAAEDKAPLAARSIRYEQPATAQYVKNRQILDEASADLFAAYGSGLFGKIDPATYPLADVARAHEDMAGRRLAGPAILLP